MSSPDGRLPAFIIVGAMRSGTSWLFRKLAEHPEVEASSDKELRFFDLHYERGLDWYRKQFPSGGRLAFEATPNYLFDRVAIDRLTSDVPDAWLIANLRHPVDRAYSHFHLRQSLGREERSWSDVVAASMAQPGPAPNDYLTRGLYVDQLRYLTQRAPHDRLLVHLFDDIQVDPAGVYARTCRFLGIDDTVLPDEIGRPVNPYIKFRSATARDALRHRGPKTIQRVVGRLNTKRSKAPEMDRAIRDQLLEWFSPANGALTAWLGRELPGWDR